MQKRGRRSEPDRLRRPICVAGIGRVPLAQEATTQACLLVNPGMAGVHGIEADEEAGELDGHEAEA